MWDYPHKSYDYKHTYNYLGLLVAGEHKWTNGRTDATKHSLLILLVKAPNMDGFTLNKQESTTDRCMLYQTYWGISHLLGSGLGPEISELSLS